MDVRVDNVPFISVQQLLKADRAEPAGESLEDSGELEALTNLARIVPASEVAGRVMPEKQPDWPAVEERARQLLERSVDIRVLITLANAALRTRGLQAFADCLCTTADLVEGHWEIWFPNERVKGELDTELRASAIADLRADPIIGGLRRVCPFLFPRLRAVALADLLVGRDGSAPDLSLLKSVVTETDALVDIEYVHDVLKASTESIVRLVSVLNANSVSVDLMRLSSLMTEATGRLGDVIESARTANESVLIGGARGDQTLNTTMQPVSSSGAFSHESAKQVLQQMIDHFVRVEPSSPVPLYLKRAQSLIGLEFSEVVRQMGDDVGKFSQT